MPQWKPFPYGDWAYRYAGDALEAAWPRLHRSDHEPFPSIQAVEVRLHCSTGLPHRPEFETDCRVLGEHGALSTQGTSPPRSSRDCRSGRSARWWRGRAAITYAMYLDLSWRCASTFCRMSCCAAKRCAAWHPSGQCVVRPCAGAWTLRTRCFGDEVAAPHGHWQRCARASNMCWRVNPQYADAHVALGLFQAELINKLGAYAGADTRCPRKKLRSAASIPRSSWCRNRPSRASSTQMRLA